jgi:GntR family transcriptional regulator
MSNHSVSQRLHEDLNVLISSTPNGGKLPTEPILARQLGVSRATLREAMRSFETQGRIHRKQGSGTYVSHPLNIIESGLEILESIETLATRKGLQVTMGDCTISRRSANNEEIEALKLNLPATVTAIDRVIFAEEHPVAYLIDILPEAVLDPAELSNGFSGSILNHLLRRGTPSLSISQTEINAVTASHEIARLMGIQRGDVLLRFVAYLYSTKGMVVDYSFSYFLPGYFRFHVIRRIGNF